VTGETKPSELQPSRRRRLLLRAAVALGGLVVAWSAFGFLIAPGLVRSAIVKHGSAALKREVRVARVRVNPLALSLTVEGFAAPHRDGSPFLAWESLYVRLAPLRLLVGDVGLAEIRLARPAITAGIAADGGLAFQDLLAGGQEKAPAPAAAARPGGAVTIAIGRLEVLEARLVFTDATRHPAFSSTLGPLTVRLEDFKTKGGGDSPYSFAGTTDAQETFRWTGTVRTQPLRSSGTLAFERIDLPRYGTYVQDLYPIDLPGGRLDFETAYDLEWGDVHRFRMGKGKVIVDGLRTGVKGAGADVPVDLPRIEITGIETDLVGRSATVEEVAFKGGTLRVRFEPDGTMELLKMLPPPSPPPPEGPFKWEVGAVTVAGATLAVEDRRTPQPVRLPMGDVRVRLEQLNGQKDHWSPLSFTSGWNGGGRFVLQGSIQPLGTQGKLDVEAADLDLVPVWPYVGGKGNGRLAAGKMGWKGKATWDLGPKPLRWSYAGDFRIDGLAAAEEGNEELLRWRALEVLGIDAASTPPRASVRTIRLVEPRTKVYVWDDGATSAARALGTPPKEKGAEKEQKDEKGAAKPAAGPEWRTAIGLFQLVRGRATFVDRSVTPAAVIEVTDAEVKVTSLSSDPKVRSTVDVALQLMGASPVRIAGTLNALQKEAYTDVTVTSKGVDLSPLGPYAGKFLGYGIQKGKLDLDLKYKVENRELNGANLVTLDQFTLGEATNSPDATKLPVRLALAMLRDPNGVIQLDVPIEGKLDDPEFKLGRVIWRTVLNVLVKVATSPFAALAALAGNDKADLSLVEFAPGTATPLPEAADRAAKLARSLAQRPAVGLEVEGVASPEADGAALRQAALERSLKRAKAGSMRSPPANVDEVTLTADERRRLLAEAYDEAFPASARKAGEPAPTPAEVEARLAAAQAVPADAYRTLAAERSQVARQALLAAGIDQARLFLAQGGERAAKEKGARAYFTVR
jgi:hypothetical protein